MPQPTSRKHMLYARCCGTIIEPALLMTVRQSLLDISIAVSTTHILLCFTGCGSLDAKCFALRLLHVAVLFAGIGPAKTCLRIPC